MVHGSHKYRKQCLFKSFIKTKQTGSKPPSNLQFYFSFYFYFFHKLLYYIYRQKRNENDAVNVSVVKRKIIVVIVHHAEMIKVIKFVNNVGAKN